MLIHFEVMWTDLEPCKELLWQPSTSSPGRSPPDCPTGAWRELCAELHQAPSTSYPTLRHSRGGYNKLHLPQLRCDELFTINSLRFD